MAVFFCAHTGRRGPVIGLPRRTTPHPATLSVRRSHGPPPVPDRPHAAVWAATATPCKFSNLCKPGLLKGADAAAWLASVCKGKGPGRRLAPEDQAGLFPGCVVPSGHAGGRVSAALGQVKRVKRVLQALLGAPHGRTWWPSRSNPMTAPHRRCGLTRKLHVASKG